MSELKENLAQEVLDCSMKVGDSMVESGGCVEAEIEVVFQKHIIKISVQPLNDIEEKVAVKNKNRSELKSNPWNMAFFWNARFQALFGRPYVNNISGKELGLMKNLLKEYPPDILREMMVWFFQNYKELDKYTGGPSLQGFMGWRRSIAHFCLDKQNKSEKENKHEHLNKLGVKI